MNGLDVKVQGTKLIVTMDISPAAIEAAEPSSTGKTRLVASTKGAIPISYSGAKLTLALNLMTK